MVRTSRRRRHGGEQFPRRGNLGGLLAKTIGEDFREPLTRDNAEVGEIYISPRVIHRTHAISPVRTFANR